MAFSVKSPQVDTLLAEVRALTGEGITEAIQHALEERLTRLQSPECVERVDWRWHVDDIQAAYQHLAHRAGEPTDESLMYDDDGLLV